MNNKIILIGMSRVGKTSIGKVLADSIKIPFIDTDKLLEKKHLASPKKIFEEFGEVFFRNSEYELIKSILRINKKMVIATGGGIIENTKSLDLLKNEKKVVFLTARIDFIFNRILAESNETKSFPAFLHCNKNTAKLKFKNIYQKRMPLYKNASSDIISVEAKTIDSICNEILSII